MVELEANLQDHDRASAGLWFELEREAFVKCRVKTFLLFSRE